MQTAQKHISGLIHFITYLGIRRFRKGSEKARIKGLDRIFMDWMGRIGEMEETEKGKKQQG